MKWGRVAVFGFLFLMLAVPVAAHVPSFPEDNTSPERALVVPDPVKSWSFYDRLSADQAKYYRVSLSAGQRLRLSVFTPDSAGFTPSVVILSRSIDGTADVPRSVAVPEGMGAEVVRGTRPPAPSYELFAPSANYHTVRVDRPVDEPTSFLIAVFEPSGEGGPVGVAVGYREAFSPAEYLTVPFDLVRVHLWEGQHPLMVFGPFLVTVLGGVVWAWRWLQKRDRILLRSGIVLAGLLLLGSAVGTAVQIVIATSETGVSAGVLVTAVFVLVPGLAGAWSVRRAQRPSMSLDGATRVGLAGAGLAGLVTWGGFILGPVFLLAVALLPAGWLSR